MTESDSTSIDEFSQWARGLSVADNDNTMRLSGIDHDHANRHRPSSEGSLVDRDEWTLRHDDSGDCIMDSMCESTTTTTCSRLTGGFTTITNICDGSPDAAMDQRCFPSHSTFQVLGVMDTTSSNGGDDSDRHDNDHDSHLGTFASYYDMQKNGPHSPDAHIGCGQMILKQYENDDDDADHSVDTEEGGRGYCEQQQHQALDCCHHRDVEDDDHASRGGQSSLSSITNEFYYFPKFNGRGRFINYGSQKKKTKNASSKRNSSSNNSPQSSKEKKSPSSYTRDTSTMRVHKGRDSLLPWYSIPRIQLQPHFHHEDYTEQKERHMMMSDQEHPIVLNNAHSSGQHAIIVASRPPSEVLISPLGHANNPLEKFPPHSSSETPSVISSSDLSQYFTNELRERYKFIIHRSYRTHYHQFINSSCAKRSIVAFVSTSLLVAMITTTTIVLGRHVPRAWMEGANVTLVIPGRDGIPYACCVDNNTGLYVPQEDGQDSNLQGGGGDDHASPPLSSESHTPGVGSIIADSGLISFSSSQGGGVEPTNNPVPALNFVPNPAPELAPAPAPSQPSPKTASPTKASKIVPSPEATPTTSASDISPPTYKPVPVPASNVLDPSILRIQSVDTTIDELRPNVNYGDEPYLSVKGSIKVALVKFDLSVLNGRSFNKATLVLHSLLNEQQDESAAQVTVGVLPQAGDWNEGSLTWMDAGSSRGGSFVVNQFQSENTQTRRHEVDVLRAIENSVRPSFQGGAPSGIVTFELYTESGSMIQFASREWNEGTLQPELMIYLSDNNSSPQPTIAPTRTPSTDEPSASPVTQIPSIDTSVSPSQSDSIAPSAPTQHPTIRMSQVPSVAASESPTGSPLNPTPSPIDPTLSPHNPTASPIDPTLSPVHPSRAPTDYPTLSPEAAAPVPVPIVLVTYDACPNELASTTMHTRNDVVSCQVGSMWKVYRCAEDHCSATGPMPVNDQSDSSWILVGTCRDGPPEPDDSKTTREATTLFPSPAPKETRRPEDYL